MDLTSPRKTVRRGKGRRHRIGRKRKRGAHAESLRVVKRVQTEVQDLLAREPEPEGGGEGGGRREKHRVLQRFKKDLHKLVGGLSGFIPEDNATMDTLQHAMFDVDDAANAYGAAPDDGALDVPDARAFAKHVAVSKLAAIRGLDSKEAYAAFLKHVDVVAEWRRERAAFFKQRREEGYVDANGRKHSPAEIAARAVSDAARRADPMASRLSKTGFGLGDEESNNASMRKLQDSSIKNARRQRDAIKAAHAARNAKPPPKGAFRHVGGYIVQPHIAQELYNPADNPPTWDHDEITRRVAEFRERSGVHELPPRETKKYVHEIEGGGWKVEPSKTVLRKLQVKERAVYNEATRSGKFLEKAEADVVIEKFLAPSTSDVERKAMMRRPREAFICAHCGSDFFKGKGKDEGKCLNARQTHERYCTGPSSSEEEDTDEDESEEEDPEEAVEPPPPKRARFYEWWPWGS